MQPLAISLIQSRVHWHRPADNRDQFEARIGELESPGDIILLPETFASGFTQAPEKCAEPMSGDSVQWMQRMARETGAALGGSLAIEDRGGYYNRFVWASPDGDLRWYDKRHLFRMAGEHERYRAGNQRVIIDYRGWRICPQICYDLRFPVWTRNRDDYDLLIFVANWPTPRAHAWRTLLRARAIENLCYVAGLNRVGTDGNDWSYAGDSAAVDFLGQTLADLGDGEGSATVSLDPEAMARFRSDFPFHHDADAFELDSTLPAPLRKTI